MYLFHINSHSYACYTTVMYRYSDSFTITSTILCQEYKKLVSYLSTMLTFNAQKFFSGKDEEMRWKEDIVGNVLCYRCILFSWKEENWTFKIYMYASASISVQDFSPSTSPPSTKREVSSLLLPLELLVWCVSNIIALTFLHVDNMMVVIMMMMVWWVST